MLSKCSTSNSSIFSISPLWYLVNKLISVVSKHTGNNDVYVYAENIKKMYKWSHVKVNINEQLINELEQILSKENIKVKV